jgi:hypothetical protein
MTAAVARNSNRKEDPYKVLKGYIDQAKPVAIEYMTGNLKGRSRISIHLSISRIATTEVMKNKTLPMHSHSSGIIVWSYCSGN